MSNLAERNEAKVDPATDPAEATAATSAEKSFTQDDLNRIAAAESRKAQGKLLKELGIEDVEALKKIIKERSELEESQKTDAEKAQQQINDLSTENSQLKSQLLGYDLEKKALKVGCDPDFIEVVAFKAKALINEDVDAEKAVEIVKKENPRYFGTVTTQKVDGTVSHSGGTSAHKETRADVINKFIKGDK